MGHNWRQYDILDSYYLKSGRFALDPVAFPKWHIESRLPFCTQMTIMSAVHKVAKHADTMSTYITSLKLFT